VFNYRWNISERALFSGVSLGLAFMFAGSAFGQEAAPAAPEQAPRVVVQTANNTIEEVIVTGQRTFQSLINEAARETENFYARLNEVLDNPDFEITCRNEYPTGSNISQRICRMRYQEELDSRAALSAIQGFRSFEDPGTGAVTNVLAGTPYDIVPEARAKLQEFEVELVEAVNADPVLNASAVRLMQLKAAVDNYESNRQEERRERQDGDAGN
jgi:hypothetical protein